MDTVSNVLLPYILYLTYPMWHCYARFTFTLELKMMDNGRNDNRQDAHANEEQEI